MVADIMLLEEAKATHQMANQSAYNGIVPDFVALLRQLILRLAQSEGRTPYHPKASHTRADTREMIVETLELLPLRDEVELVKVLMCLVDVVNTTEELNNATIVRSVHLLKDVTVQASALLKISYQGMNFDPNPKVLTLAAEASSCLMTALTRNRNIGEEFCRKRSGDIRTLVEDLLAIHLQVQSVGEGPIQVSTPFLSVYALNSRSGKTKPITTHDVTFRFPNVTDTLLHQWSSTRQLHGNSDNANAGDGVNDDRKNVLEVTTSNKTLSKIPENEVKFHDDSRQSPKTTGIGKNGLIGQPKAQEYPTNHRRHADHDRCFQLRAVSFLTDPYSFSPGQPGKVQTTVAGLDLHSCDGSRLEVKNLPQEDVLRIDIQRHHDNKTEFGFTYHLNKTNMNVHELNFGDKNRLATDLLDDESTNRLLHIHIQLEKTPLDQLAFPILVLISPVAVPYNVHSHIYKRTYNSSFTDIKIILPPQSIRADKSYSVGISEASFNSGRRRTSEVDSLEYKLSVWWDTCVYWNTEEKRWKGDGCKVMESSSLQVLRCSCTHLTSFAGIFDIIPHRLTVVSVDEFFSPHQNPLIIVVVGSVLLAYIAIVIMMRPTMKNDDDAKRKGRLVFLQDNCSTHRQKYEVVFETGFHPDAGTSSKVSLILHGDEGISETRELTTTDNVFLFERNSRNRFIITLRESPGRIVKIQLWHNNSGSSPAWFLRQATVRDLNSGLTFHFLCQRWLAVDRDDGKVEREFSTLEGSSLTFSEVFMCKGAQYLSDLHIWLSVITCPPHSRFTRLQRLFLCLALMMSYMGLAATWFQFRPPGIRGEFGLLDLSVTNIITGAAICCIVWPVYLFMGFLFRRSCVNTGSSKLPETSGGKTGLDLVSQGEDDAPQGTVPYSILDQSILNWQHIQEWAHRQWQKRQSHVISINDGVKDAQDIEHQSSPSIIPLVQQTMLAGEEDTELGSSGFEDATSQATADRNRITATSDTSSKYSDPETAVPMDAQRKVLLPWWCLYVAWVVCLLLIGAGTATTVWYGFRFSHRRSVMWIQCVYFSLITCFFILHPAMILLRTLCTSLRHGHDPAVFDMELDTEEDLDLEWEERKRREMSPWQEGDDFQQGLAARSRSRYLRFAGPLQEKQLKSTRRKIKKEKRALILLRHGFILTCLTLLMLLLAFGRPIKSQIDLNRASQQMFIGQQGENSSFTSIKSLPDWYKWSRQTLIPSISSLDSLGMEKKTNSSSELGVIVGNVRLRQFRVNPRPCISLRPLGRAVSARCFQDYSEGVEDTTYDGFGVPVPVSENHLGMWGYVAWYGRPGFVLPLSHVREELWEQFDALESSQWLNHRTRAVFVEMTIYNPSSRLYNSITLLVEVSASGKFIPSAHIRSSHLFNYDSLWDDCLMACELVLMVAVLVMFSNAAQKLFHQRMLYFKQFWNYVEMLMSLTSVLYIVMYVYRFVLVMEIVEALRSTFYEEFVNFAFLTLWDEMLHSVFGLLLFFVFLKWLGVLNYNPTIARLASVYRRSQKEVLLASVIFLGHIIAFSSMGRTLLGCVYHPMRSLASSVLTVAAVSARILKTTETADSLSSYSISIFFVFAYVFLHGLVSVYLFSVLAYRLKRTKLKKCMAMPPKRLMTFYWHYLCRQTSRRKVSGNQETADNPLSPEFIMAEILYLVEELLFRMNNLLGTSGLPEKQNSFSDSDSMADVGDDGISTGGSEDIHNVQPPLEEEINEFSELTRLEDRVHRIEDKLCSNEPYLAQLLKLDSVGSNILSEEEEQELRSQLEFEIFQQLQKQRQATSESSDQAYLMESISKMESPKLLSHENKDGLLSLTSKSTATAKQQPHKTYPDIKAHEQVYDGDSKMLSAVPVINTKSLKRSQSLKVPVRDSASLFDTSPGIRRTKQGCFLEKDIDSNLQAKLLMNRHSSVKGVKEMKAIERLGKKDTIKPTVATGSILRKSLSRAGEILEREKELVSLSHKMSSGNASPQSSEGERRHKRTDSSSGQSGVETCFDTPKMSGKRLDLPPRPTFTQNNVLSPPKARPLDLMGEWTAAESSSGSEQEAGLVSKRICVGSRNLRKTKSRGKGKGNDVDIDSAMVLSEDFNARSPVSISDCSIIIHPVPAHVDLDEVSIPEEI